MRKIYHPYFVRNVIKSFILPFSIAILSFSANAQHTIVITEIMANPAEVIDTKGEWFEIYNYGTAPVRLNKAWLSSGTTQEFLDSLHPIIVQAGAYFVFGTNDTMAVNGGVKVDYVFKKISLANAQDNIALADSHGVLFDIVTYSTVKVGKSRSLSLSHLLPNENEEEANWCYTTTLYNTVDAGTPGAANNCTPIATGIHNEQQAAQTFVLRGRQLVFPKNPSVNALLVDQTGRVVSHLETSKEIDLNNLPVGIYFIKTITEGRNETFKIALQ